MSFKFQPNDMIIEIEEHQFNVKVGDLRMIEQAQLPSADMEKTENDPTGYRSVCVRIGQQLNAILGPGAYEKIFAGRDLNLADHLAVIQYVTDELTRFNREREAALLGRNREPVITGREDAPVQ
jgi:hypothetical protein